MPKRFPNLARSARGRPAKRRIALVAAGLACLLALAAATTWLTGPDDGGTPVPTAPASSTPPKPDPTPASGPGSVPAPPRVSDPVEFAKAAARMLWSYDTRGTGRDKQLAGMKEWLTTEEEYRDFASVSARVPDPVLWSRMADQDQHATATVAEAHYPDAFKQALAKDPAAITEAYIYAVTVTGRQRIAWDGGGAGAEDRAITLAVQCRPSSDCSLVAIAPRVAP
ncbi:hypothetical protein RM572_26495 [Streptomyces sp. DSM 42041]|uniref:Secreted protein n=1 Tax=Streptomyces hazeniae TaxID=3075538 RepID=A0ABU2P1J6_9ACTN|nr:hypothetical protein [Streptomyces sp. DSM 42041]MDT0382313.1 hypothetical protein [Streptomyces sp. DSM 42041]